MKKKYILIGICFFLFVLLIFAIYHGKKTEYYISLDGVILSADSSSLTIQGDPQNEAGQRGQYIIEYNDGISIYNSNDDNINFSSLTVGDHVEILYMDYIMKSRVNQYSLDDGTVIPKVQQISIIE